MKKIKIILSALFLTLLLGTSGIYAANQAAINNVDTGVVNIKIEEYTLNDEGKEVPWVDNVSVLPGTEVSKIPYFVATGNSCYIRAFVDFTFPEDLNIDRPLVLEDLRGISDDWIRVGDYFYYKYPLDTGDSVDFFHGFVVPPQWNDTLNPRNVGDWGFEIDVTVDAIQSENFNPDFNSNSPWGEVEIQESIHKDGYDINTFTTNKETSLSVTIVDKDNIIVEPQDFFEGFKTMVPGDTLKDSVQINSKQNSKVYFTSESLTDIDLLQNMYLTLVLVKDGVETVVYDDVLDANIKDVLLGTFKKGETAELIFVVHMPEELDNQYTLRNASVKWTFRAEVFKGGLPSNPKTGDTSPSVVILLLIMLVSGTLIFILFKRRKRNSWR